jgi:branched-chain amino acid transport system substrate-binding protein
MKKVFKSNWVLLLLALPLVFSSSIFAAEEIKIGIIIPLTGPLSKIGESTKMGYEMAADDVNSRGGIKSLNGAKLKLVFADDQAKPAIGVSETEKFIEAGYPLIIGEYASSVTLAATVVSERFKVPFIVPIGVADKITERGFSYVFRINAPASIWSRTIDQFLKDFRSLSGGKEIKKLALLYEDTDWGQDTAKTHKQLAKEFGFEIVADESYPNGAADVTSKIAKIKAAKPDVLLPVSYIQDAILIAETRARLNFNPIVLSGGGGALEPEYTGLNATNLELTICHWNRDFSKEAENLNNRFKDKYKVNMNGNIAACYQSVMVAAAAIEKAGSTDRQKIRDSLASLNIKPGPELIMPYAEIKFDEKGQNKSSLLVVQMRDKSTYTIWPKNYAASNLVMPK